MGEAKRRREQEKNFGKVPKDAKGQGLIICPPMTIEESTLSARSSNLDPQELRFALLFWDHLVWPASRAVYFANGPDEDFLQSAGVLTRPDYTFYGDAAQGILKGQIQAYLDYEAREPGRWALSQGENSLLVKGGVAEADKGVLLELHRAIPIPQHEVPLAEILEFKERRRDELGFLRHQIDTFMYSIEQAEDKQAAFQKQAKEIDLACADLLRVSKEWQSPVYLSNLKAAFSFSPLKFLPAVGGAWKLAEPYGLQAATAVSAMAGIASTLEVKGDFGWRGAKRPMSPYRYASSIYKELR